MDVAVDRPAGRVTRGRVAGTVVIVLIIGLATLSALLFSRLQAASAADGRRDAILEAAHQEAVNFTTIDYRHADRDFGRVLDGATGPFRKQFATVGDASLKKLIVKNKQVTTGDVKSVGLVSSDADSARVIVAADSRIRSTGQPDGTVRHYRMLMHLAREHGTWLTSKIEFVG